MKKFFLAVLVPTMFLVVLWLFIPRMGFSTEVMAGIQVGLVVALVQSLISVTFLRWAWNKKIFYWVWGGGLLLRTLVFASTAVVVYRLKTVHLMATMLSLVSATTGFLILEASLYSNKKR